MDDLLPPAKKRSSDGRWLKGHSGNPGGRLPRASEDEFYIKLTETVSPDRWQSVVDKAISQAEEGDGRAREWLGKYLMGEPAQIHEHLSLEVKDITIRVVFADNESETQPPNPDDVIDGVVVDAAP